VSAAALVVLGAAVAATVYLLNGYGNLGGRAPASIAIHNEPTPSPWSASTLAGTPATSATSAIPATSAAGARRDGIAGSARGGGTVSTAGATPAVTGSATGATGAGRIPEVDRRAGITTTSLVRHGSGRLQVVPGSVPAPRPAAPSMRVRVEVEEGIGVDNGAFAAFVMKTLNDPRGWAHGGRLSFARTDGQADFRVVLASPDSSAQLCAPARTEGTTSCGGGDRAVITMFGWLNGIPDYGKNRTGYRQYIINHEVGHVLGHHHTYCTPGRLAPVMVQQTNGLHGCRPNSWPFPSLS
jgi:hypothetical protein